MNIGMYFENGKVSTISEIINSESTIFSPHPKFQGVYLKNLVTGDMTDNKVSCHLVKVESFCTLDNHVHENNLEIHEVISGDATCFIGENEVTYTAGTVGIIPENILHKIKAGANGIYILAKFIPALV